jgi:hypothetical protein
MLVDDLGNMMGSQSGTVGANSTGVVNMSSSDWSPSPGNREISIRLLDSRGILVTSNYQNFEVRRSDWNVGLVQLELDGQGASQKIEISTKRDNHELLPVGTQCVISIVVEGQYSSTHLVDMTTTNALAPKPSIDRPDVDDDEELVATISCSFPWDQDADPSDDEARIILSGGEDIEIGISDSSTAIAAAAIVIGASIAISWMISNYREGKEMMEKARLAVEKKAIEKRASIEESKRSEPVDSSEELSEGMRDEMADTEAKGAERGPSEDTPPVGHADDDSFESRLNRLTGDR